MHPGMPFNTKPARYGAAFAGAVLLAWEKIWWLISWWADIDFVSQRAGGVSKVLSFMASPGFSNVANLLGIALIVLAFLMVERRHDSTLQEQDQPKGNTTRVINLGLLPLTPAQLCNLY